MNLTANKRRAFTLIELLVVIAIIGILSSVVLASLNASRQRANTAAIKAQVLQFKTLMELEFSETGSYENLSRGTNSTGPVGWSGAPAVADYSCANEGYAGTHAARAVEICEKIVSLATGADARFEFWTGIHAVNIPTLNTKQNYSLMAALPDGTFFCVGSSGGVTQSAPNSGLGYAMPGCLRNP